MKNFILDANLLDVYRLLSSVEKQAEHATVLRSVKLSVTPANDTTKIIYSLTISVYTPVQELTLPQEYLLQHILTTTDPQVANLLFDGGGAGEKQDYHKVLLNFAAQPGVRLAKFKLLAAA